MKSAAAYTVVMMIIAGLIIGIMYGESAGGAMMSGDGVAGIGVEYSVWDRVLKCRKTPTIIYRTFGPLQWFRRVHFIW